MIADIGSIRSESTEPVKSRLRFPTFWIRRPVEPAPPEAVVEIHRQPLSFAADWQTNIVDRCRELRTLNPEVFQHLSETGLRRRCVYLSSDGDGPLLFRYIGEPTVRYLGVEWAKSQLGKPDLDDPHQSLAEGIGAQYREAIEGGVPVFNRIMITGLSADPKIYTHVLIGWRLPEGRRALLSLLNEF